MINRIKQSVELLPSISEEAMLNMFEHVMAAPYGNGLYDLPKTQHVIEGCVKRGHLSVLEHGNITLKCVTNIGTYKDYTRHRHCAFTIESTSFTKYDDLTVITCLDISEEEQKLLEDMLLVYRKAVKNNVKYARDFLPQCSAAVMIMTTNIRQWRNIIAVRGDKNDNPLTNELRHMIWRVLNNSYPFFFPIDDNTVTNPMCIYNTWGDRGPAVIA